MYRLYNVKPNITEKDLLTNFESISEELKQYSTTDPYLKEYDNEMKGLKEKEPFLLCLHLSSIQFPLVKYPSALPEHLCRHFLKVNILPIVYFLYSFQSLHICPKSYSRSLHIYPLFLYLIQML